MPGARVLWRVWGCDALCTGVQYAAGFHALLLGSFVEAVAVVERGECKVIKDGGAGEWVACQPEVVSPARVAEILWQLHGCHGWVLTHRA